MEGSWSPGSPFREGLEVRSCSYCLCWGRRRFSWSSCRSPFIKLSFEFFDMWDFESDYYCQSSPSVSYRIAIWLSANWDGPEDRGWWLPKFPDTSWPLKTPNLYLFEVLPSCICSRVAPIMFEVIILFFWMWLSERASPTYGKKSFGTFSVTLLPFSSSLLGSQALIWPSLNPNIEGSRMVDFVSKVC